MRKGYKVTLGVLTIMILITLTIGTSYSYYSVGGIQTSANSLKSCTSISSFSGSNDINLTNTYPMDDAKGLATTPYTFTITNNCLETDTYNVYLYVYDETDETINQYIKYSLDGKPANYITGTSNTTGLTVIESSNVILSDEAGITKTDAGDIQIDGLPIDTVYLLTSGTLSGKNSSKTYNLRLWVGDLGDNSIMGKSFKAKIVVSSSGH